MKFTRRPDVDPQTRIHIVMLAWLYQGVYGKMTQLAHSYHISRTFLFCPILKGAKNSKVLLSQCLPVFPRRRENRPTACRHAGQQPRGSGHRHCTRRIRLQRAGRDPPVVGRPGTATASEVPRHTRILRGRRRVDHHLVYPLRRQQLARTPGESLLRGCQRQCRSAVRRAQDSCSPSVGRAPAHPPPRADPV